jgi:NitT/TauT family transport system ATP-binding protein
LASGPYSGNTELAKIIVSLSFDINDLLPIAAALHILEIAVLNGSSIRLTAAGRVFAQNDSDERERLFLEHLIRFVPLVAHIRQVLDGERIMSAEGAVRAPGSSESD